MARKKKQKVDETSLESTFFASFVGEYVEIVCKVVGATKEITLPVVVNGFLLDIDDDFYYLSDNGTEVSKAVRKDGLIIIEVAKQKTPEEEILDNLTRPITDDEVM
jgi:hypothetical protein